MNINDILTGGGITLVVVLTLIQITPVKINPWTAIGKLIKKLLSAIGKAFNSDLLQEMSSFKKELSDVKSEVSSVQKKVDAMSDASAEQAAINLQEISSVKKDLYDVKTELSAVQGQVDAMSKASGEQAAINARARILRFGDEVLHGQPLHSKDHFDSILKDCKAYEKYCATHEDFENGVTEPTIERIRAVYRERLEKNDFM